MTVFRPAVAAAPGAAVLAASAYGRELDGTHRIDLIDGQGAATTIGQIAVVDVGEGRYRFEVKTASVPFDDHFLPMKPFKWLPQPAHASVGVLHETDLDVLAALPQDGDLRPIRADAPYEAELDQHAFPRLVIR